MKRFLEWGKTHKGSMVVFIAYMVLIALVAGFVLCSIFNAIWGSTSSLDTVDEFSVYRTEDPLEYLKKIRTLMYEGTEILDISCGDEYFIITYQEP